MSSPLTSTVPENGIRAYKNDTGTTIPAHSVVVRDASTERGIKLPAAVTDDVVGVTMQAIPDDGCFYDVQIRGRAIVIASAAIADGARLMPTTAGKVATWSAAGGANAAVVGTGEGAPAADGDLFVCELAGPAVSRQG